MKKFITLVTIFMMVITIQNAFAEKTSQMKKSDNTIKSAEFSVPKLDKNLVETISKTLSKEKAVLSAKPNLEKKTMDVVFDSKLLEKDVMIKLITKVAPGSKLVKISDHDKKSCKSSCGKCPSRSKCSSKAKTK